MSAFLIWFWLSLAVIVIPSTPIHLMMLLTVREGIRKGKYNSLFFRLFVVQSWLDLVLFYLFLAFQIIVKVQPFGGDLLLSDYFPSNFYYYGTIHFFFNVQMWGVTLQSFVRFVNICASESKVKKSNSINSTVMAVVATVICALCYAFIMRELIRHRIKHRAHRSERALTLVGFSLFLCFCTYTAFYLIGTLDAFTNNDVIIMARHFYIIPVVLVTFVNPWMLTVTHKSLRNR